MSTPTVRKRIIALSKKNFFVLAFQKHNPVSFSQRPERCLAFRILLMLLSSRNIYRMVLSIIIKIEIARLKTDIIPTSNVVSAKSKYIMSPRVRIINFFAYVPEGVLLGEAADDGVIVSGPEIVSPSLLVIILPGVAEGVGIRGDRVLHWGLPGFYFVFW